MYVRSYVCWHFNGKVWKLRTELTSVGKYIQYVYKDNNNIFRDSSVPVWKHRNDHYNTILQEVVTHRIMHFIYGQ